MTNSPAAFMDEPSLPMPPDWPEGLPKPVLPEGYKWIGMHPCGKRWGIFVLWTERTGQSRFINTTPRFHETPERAVKAAVAAVARHRLEPR